MNLEKNISGNVFFQLFSECNKFFLNIFDVFNDLYRRNL